MEIENQIIIFLKNGKTLFFQKVSNLEVEKEFVAFNYFGVSTEQNKTGAFFYSNIAGWSASANLTLD